MASGRTPKFWPTTVMWAAQSVEQNLYEPRRVAAPPIRCQPAADRPGQAAFRLMARQAGHLVNLPAARGALGGVPSSFAQVIRLGHAAAERELVPHQRGSPARLRGSRAQTNGVIEEDRAVSTACVTISTASAAANNSQPRRLPVARADAHHAQTRAGVSPPS
jgi:hypothetical protein